MRVHATWTRSIASLQKNSPFIYQNSSSRPARDSTPEAGRDQSRPYILLFGLGGGLFYWRFLAIVFFAVHLRLTVRLFLVAIAVAGVHLLAVGGGYGDDFIALSEVHHAYALGVASGAANGVDVGANNDAACRDNHQVAVVFGDDTGRRDQSRFVGNFGRDYTAAAAPVTRVFLDGSSLAKAVFHDNQQFASLWGEIERNNAVARGQANTAHAAAHARSCAQFFNAEADGLPLSGNQQ